MPREKTAYRAIVDYVSSLVWVTPVNPGAEPLYRDKVPAIEAVMPDGRKVYVTLETTFSVPTDRARYIERMRKMAATLSAAADRAERETGS